ncbi:FMP10 (YER182W) [Zygosaccharomyces parabailii]|nr:FMP10 (YER182W) [Zygosaccharomyces parabailii]SJM87676.1 related to Fmp10p [Zygosaccharomyces bailii]
MFKRFALQPLKRAYSASSGGASGAAYKGATKTFIVRPKPKDRKWVPWAIFGGSFLTGWILTQHMTISDFLAFWKYDKLPQSSQEVENYKQELYSRCEHLPVIKQLKKAGFREVFPDRRKHDLLVDNTLNTPGGVAIAPRFYYNPTSRETVGVYHLGMKLTGYPFIVHGGILVTIVEDLMREAVQILRSKPGEKTKDLAISYKLPTLANQFVIVRTTKIEEFGKNTKLYVDVMDQSGNRKLLSGKGTFST